MSAPVATSATSSVAAKKTHQEMKTSNYIAISVVVTVLVVVLAGYFGKMLVSSILANQKLITHKSVAAKTLESDITNGQKLVQEYNDLASYKQTLKNVLPSDPDFPGIANALEEIASESGVVYTNASSSSASATSATTVSSASGMPNTQSFSFALTGGSDGLKRFLSNVESSARPIHIDDINISGTVNKLSVTIDATTYYQSPSTFKITSQVVK